LRRGKNQTRVGGRILRLELTNRFKVAGVPDDLGELLDLFELIQAHLGFLVLRIGNSHDVRPGVPAILKAATPFIR
jgi:hypothetical protein